MAARLAYLTLLGIAFPVCLLQGAPALASDPDGGSDDLATTQPTEPSGSAQPPFARIPQGQEQEQEQEQKQGQGRPDIVFDDNWVSLGIGAGAVPSYSGSNNYRAFPLPLIVGRVGGIGISPNGPGFNLDLLPPPPARGVPETSFSFGPSVRFRNDRDDQINDPVVAAAGSLDTALEVGVNGGVSIPAVFVPQDRLSFSSSVRWDVLGAHYGMLVEPGIGYFTPINRGFALQVALGAQFVDDDFADYYYSVSPAQSAASGLPEFQADGGLNSLGVTAITTVDLSGNLLDGGWSLYAVTGYSRLVGDAADTPYTQIRGSADQFIGGLGVAYTF